MVPEKPPSRVLNVGGGGSRTIPAHFDGWLQHVLDIDSRVEPDICCDALEMSTLDAGVYDAVFCSHNLEHFYLHDVPTVLKGFLHVLAPNGFAEIIVPSFTRMMDHMRMLSLDLSDTWYRTASGNPITFHDVLYGFGAVMEQGNLYYAHKCAFTQISLGKLIIDAGFKSAEMWEDGSNLYARAFKGEMPCRSQ